MYIIFNSDGSIKKTDFNEFVNKGSDNVNKIFVKVEGRSDYDAYAIFKLPNGEVAGPIIGEWVNDYSEEDYPEHTIYLGDGMLISISQDVTAYAGIVKATIQVTDDDEENPTILYTYPVMLTINDTEISPSDLTQANLSQYFNLKKYINESIDNIYDLKPYSLSENETVESLWETFGTNLTYAIYRTNPYFLKLEKDGDAYRVYAYTFGVPLHFAAELQGSSTINQLFSSSNRVNEATKLYKHTLQCTWFRDGLVQNPYSCTIEIISTDSREYTTFQGMGYKTNGDGTLKSTILKTLITQWLGPDARNGFQIYAISSGPYAPMLVGLVNNSFAVIDYNSAYIQTINSDTVTEL